MNIIVAYDENHAIGKNNQLLWKMGEMPDDMRRFRTLTEGGVVIMGRKTLESIGMRALPHRKNIVVSHTLPKTLTDIEVVRSLEEVYKLVNTEESFIIGGQQLYQEALDLDVISRIYATEVKASFDSADSFFPSIQSEEWNETERSTHLADLNNNYSYDFVTYDRK